MKPCPEPLKRLGLPLPAITPRVALQQVHHGRKTTKSWLPPSLQPFLAIAIALGLAFLALYRFPPDSLPCGLIDVNHEGARVPSLLAQLHDPVRWDLSYDFCWAQRGMTMALRWRMLIPVVCRDLGISDSQYLWVPWVGNLALLVAVAYYSWRSARDPSRLTVAVGLFVTSSAWTNAVWGIGCMDAWYLLALLLFSFSPSTTVALAACLFGPWVDERFLLALPLCAVLRGCDRRSDWLRNLWPALGVLPYCAIRLIAHFTGDPTVDDQFQLQGGVFWRFAAWLPIGWWHGWRMGWVVIVPALVAVWNTRPAFAGILARWAMAAGFACLLMIYFLAWDSSRSIAVMLPWIVLGVSRTRLPAWALWLLVALNFYLPAAYVTAAAAVGSPISPVMAIH